VISGRLYAGPEVDVWSCGVILYALLCGSLPFYDESIPNLFKKIKGGIYTLPSHLSPGARDLIARTLLVDPLKRITIPEIRAHPWFMLHLPRYLAVPPPDTAAQASKVDPESLDAVVAMGFDRAAVVEALRRQIRNKATVAYYLICDNKRNGGVTGYLGAEFDEACQASLADAMAHAAATGGAGGGGNSGGPMGARRPSNVAQALLQQRITALQQAWQLGVVTRAHPAECMAEVHRALGALGIRWKRQGSGGYTLRCMAGIGSGGGSSAGTGSPPGASPVVKFELQLYRLKEERYAVDIQRTEGDLMVFMDVSAALLAEMRT
jgi:5'-AMP-activated protein kinase catalytic alpha subunit